MGKRTAILTLGAGVVLSRAATGATCYVDGSVDVSSDGKAWETAFKTIQEGIDAASDGEMIVLAQETCIENIRFNRSNVILRSIDPIPKAPSPEIART